MIESLYTKIMQKKIDGVLGRLGDMGKTTSEYDCIITSAFGAQLDNIVVTHFEAAQAVINLLKT